MLSSRWVFDNNVQQVLQRIYNIQFPAFFLRVQLCPAPTSHCRHVFTHALHTTLQGITNPRRIRREGETIYDTESIWNLYVGILSATIIL